MKRVNLQAKKDKQTNGLSYQVKSFDNQIENCVNCQLKVNHSCSQFNHLLGDQQFRFL